MGNVTVVLLNNDYMNDLEREPFEFFRTLRSASLDPMWDRRPEHQYTRGFEVGQYHHSSATTFWANWRTRLQMMSSWAVARSIENGDDPERRGARPVTDGDLNHLQELAEQMQREATEILAVIEKTRTDRANATAKAN
jgi:hypothetical protein